MKEVERTMSLFGDSRDNVMHNHFMFLLTSLRVCLSGIQNRGGESQALLPQLKIES